MSASEEQGHISIISPLGLRSALLFTDFLLIITAYYHLKPASRSLFIESLGADRLPYVWIGTALTMGLIITAYHKLVAETSRLAVVLGSCLTVSALLIVFRLLFIAPSASSAIGFYIFTDILSVILVEQFWSLTNTLYSSAEGKRWYGFIATGGLSGGVIGGVIAAFLIKKAHLETADLLLVAAFIFGLIALLTWRMGKAGLYREVAQDTKQPDSDGGWRASESSRYLILIAIILLLAQLASPLIEFQFLKAVESVYGEKEARTAFLAQFFSVLGLVAITINLIITPLIHRYLGVIAGLLVQPLLMGACSFGFFLHPTLLFGAITKISDRGLSYSINRASKELLYVLVPPLLIYQAKAWIDMFGYRLFKIFGSLLILLFTQWLPVKLASPQLSWFTITFSLLWIWAIVLIRQDYLLACQAANCFVTDTREMR